MKCQGSAVFCSRYVEEKGGILAGNTVPGIGWKHPGVIHHGDGPVGKAWEEPWEKSWGLSHGIKDTTPATS